jgi:predicted peptidase
MSRLLALLAACAAFLPAFAQTKADKPAPKPFVAPATKLPPTAKKFATADGKESLDYLVYLPADYDKDKAKQWTLVVFLHGAGERGSDVQVVRKTGLTQTIEQRGAIPYLMVAPQCPANAWWNVGTLDKFLDQVLADYRVDKKRVVLTGLSMGGFGTWAWSVEHPERFAGLAPICAGGKTDKAAALKGIPIWAFHGDADPTVKLAAGQAMVDAAKAAGADVKFTVYPGVGHNSWGKAYAEPELEGWILARKK